MRKFVVPAVICVAIFLRLILIPNPGFEADVSFWKSWGLATVDRGIVEGMKVTNNNYPTPFAYTLGAMVAVYRLFADPHNFDQFWTNTNLLFLAVSKLLPILADFGIAALILYIGRNTKKLGFPEMKLHLFGLGFYEILAAAYLLSPVSLMDGAWWGQVDSLGVVIFLASVVLVLKRMPFWAGLIYMLSMMTKLQNMIYGPLFFLFVWQTGGYPSLVRAAAGALIGFGGLNIEFFLTRNADRVLSSLTENYDYFPWMSLMAYNLWWIVTGARGLVTSDKLLVLGLLNAKTVGLLIFSSLYLFAFVKQLLEPLTGRMLKSRGGIPFRSVPTWPWREGPDGKNNGSDVDGAKTRNADLSAVVRSFIESLIIVNAAFFLFQTQSHDRYAFPLSVFLLLWAPFYASGNGVRGMSVRVKQLTIFYSLYTVFYFYNLHTALVVNYPANGLPFLTSLTQPLFTIGTAFVLLGLFGVFMYSLVRASKTTPYIAFVVVGILVSALLYLNKPLITRTPVPLTSFTPYISEQSYGTRQTNRSVQSSFGGPFTWTRLSVQYLFYSQGIGSHANSRYVYDLKGNFRRFSTDMGVDTESGTRASVVFEIRGDGNLLYRSKRMGRFDLPEHADVDISGIQQLTLIISDAGDGNFDDHADWLNPILSP